MGGLGVNIGLRALLTSRAALDTIGHNVSNANTPGYSRQTLHVSSARPLNLRGLQLGHGVKSDVVLRTADQLLNRRIVDQVGSLGRLESQLLEMTSVEALLDVSGGGFGAVLDGFFDSMASLSTEPEDLVLRAGVVQATQGLTAQFHHVAGEVDQLRADAEHKARALAEDVNVKAEKILQLNREIAQVEASGVAANDLRDQRDETLRQLARLVSVRTLEDAQGSIVVQIDGQLLVGSQTVHELRVEVPEPGDIRLFVGQSSSAVEPTGGELAGIQTFAREFASGVLSELDRYANALVREVNRAHSTGVPLGGGFTTLTGVNPVPDADGDGNRTEVLLRDAGLPFDVVAGELFVHVVDQATGERRTERIAVDPARMTVGDLVDRLSAIDGISAGLDSTGRLQVVAASEHRFHFGRPLAASPDLDGTFGGGRASLTLGFDGPFALAGGQTLDLAGPLGPFTVTFDSADFANISAATAAEVAAAINAEPATGANSLRAVVVGDRVALQTIGSGSSETFDVVGGSALGSLGIAAGTHTGQDLAVTARLTGEYEGDANDRWTFETNMDGTIGTTPGLQLIVRDAAGETVATLDVGDTYAPGNDLLVAEGVSVSLTAGEVRASENDRFVAEMIQDSDTSDVLVALGLNALLVGDDATTIGLRAEIASDPRALAASATGGVGDAGALRDLIGLQGVDVADLGGTLGEFHGTLVGQVGFDISSTRNAAEVEGFLVESLEERREAVSGVNVDEELVNMVQYEQAYGAAAQFLQVVNGLQDEILNLV